MPKKLPASHLRPPISNLLDRHRRMLTELNDFYWGVGAAFHLLEQTAGAGSAWTSDFLPEPFATKWRVPSSGVAGVLLTETTRLRYVVLVQAVTYYEDFLDSTLIGELLRRPLPDKKPRLQVDLSALPTDAMPVGDFIKPLYARSVTDDVMKENYLRRAGRVHKALEIDPADTDPPLLFDLGMVGAACEARNCIVHAGGTVDERCYQAIKEHIAGIAVGTALALTEKHLFAFMEAMKEHVEAIDLLVRLRR